MNLEKESLRGQSIRKYFSAAIRLLIVSSIAILPGCDSTANEIEPEPGSLDLNAEWQTARPDDVGMSAALLERANAKASSLSRMRSLLVTREGKLVMERYYGGTTDMTLFDVRSVTKSVVSTLVGIAVDRGSIESVDEPIGEYIRSTVEDVPPGVSALTFRHLLTMSSGFEWPEQGGSAYSDWISSGNYVQYL